MPATTTEQAVEETLVVAGSSIASLHRGSGHPVIVLHHSFGSPGWLPFYDRMATDFEVNVPDLPGFGQSKVPAWARHPRDLAILIGWWLRKKELGPVAVVGCGFGGWVAAELGTLQPQALSHLVLVGASGLLPQEGRIFDQFLTSHSEYVQRAFKNLENYEAVYGSELSEEVLLQWDFNREMTTRIAWKPYMYNRALIPLLIEVVTPTLIVWGEDDQVVPRECADQYLQLLPDAHLEVVADCGHAVDMEKPERLAALVQSHLSAH